ncbi:MAG TPA: hypothetical protein VHG51_20795 [Longimicrobiaceae bacterium]|nr:hypothetical protein [Longimicrobiaceae bacterium]
MGAFSVKTRSPTRDESISRMSTLRHPSAGELRMRPPRRSTIPGTTSPIPSQSPSPECRRSSPVTRSAIMSVSRSGSATVARVSMAICCPPRSESRTQVLLKRTSMATTRRSRVRTCSIMGRRPRGDDASAPS